MTEVLECTYLDVHTNNKTTSVLCRVSNEQCVYIDEQICIYEEIDRFCNIHINTVYGQFVIKNSEFLMVEPYTKRIWAYSNGYIYGYDMPDSKTKDKVISTYLFKFHYKHQVVNEFWQILHNGEIFYTNNRITYDQHLKQVDLLQERVYIRKSWSLSSSVRYGTYKTLDCYILTIFGKEYKVLIQNLEVKLENMFITDENLIIQVENKKFEKNTIYYIPLDLITHSYKIKISDMVLYIPSID